MDSTFTARYQDGKWTLTGSFPGVQFQGHAETPNAGLVGMAHWWVHERIRTYLGVIETAFSRAVI